MIVEIPPSVGVLVQIGQAEAGLELVAMYDAFTKEPPREDSERVYVVARERGK